MSPAEQSAPSKSFFESPMFRRTSSSLFVGLCLIITYLYILRSSPQLDVHNHLLAPTSPSAPIIWSEIDTIFVFGDSYSSTSFDVQSPDLPTQENVFGNPPSASKLLASSPWVHFLGTEYTPTGKSNGFRIFNHAVGGSVLHKYVVQTPQNLPIQSYYEQVNYFAVNFAQNITNWDPARTLFISFFGINDIIIKSRNLDTPPQFMFMWALRESLDNLYNAGARKFLVMNVPPFYHALHKAKQMYTTQAIASVGDYNEVALEALEKFHMKKRQRGGSRVSVKYFDTFSLWDKVLNNPRTFPETAQLTKLDSPCHAYADAAVETYNGNLSIPRTDIEPDLWIQDKCEAPVDQYFWLNHMHATYPIHKLTARVMVEQCFGKKSSPPRYCI